MTYDERIRAEAGGAEQAARAFGLAAFGRSAATGVAPVAGAAAEAAEAGGGAAVLAGLKAVRVERLARRIEAMAVKAGQYEESKHPRGAGGKWAQGTAHADPPGGPSGRIRHAVLVIGGKRWRGPSHFQAMIAAAGRRREPWSVSDKIEKEGFETESGHFLDRDQAASYVGKQGQWLGSEHLHLAAVDGQLYTQDAVMAAHLDDPVLEEHDAARSESERTYRRTVDAAVAALAVEALAEQARKKKDEKAKKRRREELFAALALLLFGASVTIYRALRQRLAKTIPGQTPGAAGPTPAAPVPSAGGSGTAGGLATPSPTGQNAPKPTPGPIATGIAGGPEDAEAFAAGRASLVADFPKRVLEALDLAAKEAAAEGRDAATAVHDRADQASAGQGRVVSETEAQAAYGKAMFDTLKAAGFETKVWTTMEDDKVRPSHVECGNQGEVPMGQRFANGLMYPGDPSGGPEEVCSCRCWLVGGRRVPGTGHLTASEPFDEAKHPRGEHGKWRSGEAVRPSQIYHSPLRPVMSISHYLPKGWELHGEVKNAGEHRTFRVPKPLTSEQVKQWELEPQDPQHPANIKKAYEKFHDEVMDKYSEKGALQVTMPSGSFMIVSETIGDEKHPFRITRFMKDGTPSGHEVFGNFDEVSRYLFGFREGTIQASEPHDVSGEARDGKGGK